MTAEDLIRDSFATLEVNENFSEAVLLMRDDSRLQFRHRVGERWVKAESPGNKQSDATLAGQVLSQIALFRLNAKHLDIEFADGSRWEARFRGS
jgi:hypothetical protein